MNPGSWCRLMFCSRYAYRQAATHSVRISRPSYDESLFVENVMFNRYSPASRTCCNVAGQLQNKPHQECSLTFISFVYNTMRPSTSSQIAHLLLRIFVTRGGEYVFIGRGPRFDASVWETQKHHSPFITLSDRFLANRLYVKFTSSLV